MKFEPCCGKTKHVHSNDINLIHYCCCRHKQKSKLVGNSVDNSAQLSHNEYSTKRNAHEKCSIINFVYVLNLSNCDAIVTEPQCTTTHLSRVRLDEYIDESIVLPHTHRYGKPTHMHIRSITQTYIRRTYHAHTSVPLFYG